jgi:small subunit ribosomal protein S11
MAKYSVGRSLATTIKGLRCQTIGCRHSIFRRSVSNSCPRRAEDNPTNTSNPSPTRTLSAILASQSSSREVDGRSNQRSLQGPQNLEGTANLLKRFKRDDAAPSKRYEPFLDSSSNLPVASLEPPHGFYVYATKHNTHITLTRPSRDPILSVAAGNIGFKKAARGSYDAAYQLAAYVMGRIQEQGLMAKIHQLEVVLRGFGAGREAVTKALLGSEGRNLRGRVVRVTDATRLKFGGTRSPKPRRLG